MIRARQPEQGEFVSPDPTLALLDRLARVVGAMAQNTQWHDQMFSLIADIQELQLRERQSEGGA